MTEAKGDSTPTFAVEVNNMCFDYRQKKNVLKNVSLKLQPGSRCLLVGDNGAGTLSPTRLSHSLTHTPTHTSTSTGKTTLLRILGGKHHIPAKQCKVLGRESMFSSELNFLRSYLGGDWGKRTVAFVGYGVPMTADIAVKNLMVKLQEEFPKRRDRLYELLDIDPDWNMSYVSDGQRRRVQIMLGLLRPFELLLLDEITTDLDVVTRMDLLKFLKEETETRKVTIVYATHIFDGLDGWPTDVLCLHRGVVEKQGSYDDVVGKKQSLMNTIAKWIREGRARIKREGGVSKKKEKLIEPDGSAGGFAPGRLSRFMAYA